MDTDGTQSHEVIRTMAIESGIDEIVTLMNARRALYEGTRTEADPEADPGTWSGLFAG
jgi:hypothetical protein